jgi:hypothetical protein
MWDNFILFKDKVFDVAEKAWDAFTEKSSEAWDAFISWLTGLPQKAWDLFIKLKDKLWDVAKWAWENFFSKSVEGWKNILLWIAGLPQAAWDKFILLKTKLTDIASQAFTAFVSKAKGLVDGAGGLMSWVAGIPGRIAGLLGSVGSKVADSVKAAWNTAANWINNNGLSKVNAVTSKFGFTLGRIPTFQRGGIVPGTMTTRDSVIAALRPKEGVLIPEAVKAIGGAAGLAKLNDEAKRGHVKPDHLGVPGYSRGGMVGDGIGDWLAKGAGWAMDKILAPFEWGIRSAMPDGFMEDWTAGWVKQWREKAKAWGDEKQTAAGGNSLGGIGYQKMVDVLRQQFPGIVITSTYRPGSITASGNQSYHALGRAVDMAPDMAYFNWIHANYGKTSKELIYSPAGNRQIKNGQSFVYGEPVRSMHYNHVHWAYDRGGILPPGYTAAFNGTRKDELVLTNGDMMRLSNVLSMMDRHVTKSGSGATPGAATVARMSSTMTSLEARLRAQEKSRSATVRGGTGSGTQVVINGDLVMPNIKSGDDADLFIRHLKTLAGD